ncbi:Guanine nucleotide-binding protein subunit alpha-1 [Tritrichomonas foetus]|uniref:Guanine nucleotide-binding protein subunit alpha-1 n=1 Tax=Tritrichomonas foetus TaxID=1144522 RepID=A0A1J4J1V4_9EUKA|nr:Guanine nucleotide-binding protein subunit alpha-1 [Tritrichomonas foetus]|eukprot:OHS93486.1 Guanine nucleotide-binding protein subunit alpha-1 [Tritrichomonas foetus]
MGCSASKPYQGDATRGGALPASPQLAQPPQAQPQSQSPQQQQQLAPQTVETAPAEQPAQPKEEQPVEQPPQQPPAEEKPAESAPLARGVKDDETEAFGLLLCGAGESGKTTFTRQLKLKFLGGIQKEDRLSFVQTIRGNMVESMQQLIFWVERHDKEISSEFDEDVAHISELNAFDCEFSPELADKLKQLWQDAAIQEAFEHKDETIIPDHMDYFFEKIDELVEDDYVPSDDDVLRARIRSIGIDSVTLLLEGALIRIYDVGGQKNERSKWDKVMNEVGGVIFCVSFAEYDKPCFEDTSLLRINDALEIFKEVTHRENFKEDPFFLICNKFDTFSEKVRTTDSFTKVFPDYTGDAHDPEACRQYLVDKFIEASNPPLPDRPIIVYTQSALDSSQVVSNANEICKYICSNFFEE